MKQDESNGCLKPSYVLESALWPLSGKVDAVTGGPKEIKSKARTILETIFTLYKFSNNSYLKIDIRVYIF